MKPFRWLGAGLLWILAGVVGLLGAVLCVTVVLLPIGIPLLMLARRMVTTAGKLPFKGVIHAVGPRQGEGDEEAKLVLALTHSFQQAKARGWDSVSFPAVSSGIFAVPLDVCARAYAKAARASPLANVRLCLRDQPVIDAVLRELGK